MLRINPTHAVLMMLLIICVKNAVVCNIANPPSVTIGNYAALCFQVQYMSSSSVNPTVVYYVYRVKIDQFTSLKLNNLSFNFTNTSAINANVTIYFQNQQIGSTFLLLNKTNTTSIQRSILSVVVNTVGGSYDSIVGDNFCDSSCGSCYNGECFDIATSNAMDLRVYVSWGGSDSKNNQFLSQASRLSRFNLYSVSSLYSSVKNVYFS